MLTLLCLVFGENADFPANRSELYKEGLDILLKKWDAKRNIERDQVYRNLSRHRKEDLLSQIALATFERKEYFFKQRNIEVYISDFIYNLHDARTEPQELELDSEVVLKSIESQHGLLIERAKGIYSFSHLTFQEYFTAREIVASSTSENLVEHITETRWREVFLLTVGMMQKADDLVQLMKQKIDDLIASDKKLQQFLIWLNQKSLSVELPYKLAAVRAFYFDYDLMGDFNGVYLTLPYALESRLADDDDLILNFEYNKIEELREIALDHNLVTSLNLAFEFKYVDQVEGFIYSALYCLHDCNFKRLLQMLYEQLPEVDEYEVGKSKWNHQAWSKQLRSLMIEHRNIGHDWQFNHSQKELLRWYYDANLLLVDCLNSDCYISREIRQEIEDTLLLPMNELKSKSFLD
ncbi:hypothetical protein WKK05_32155 [Nostoc sp. UHCC 0302]|uniref:NACHT domain-containing protein n=1 Tax=Nostoc sp. UHCC 0302 TaxID=3134896 RepID=UPI00311CBD00